MAHRIGNTPIVPQLSGNLQSDLQQMFRAFYADSVDLRSRLRDAFPKDGSEPFEAPLPFQVVANAAALPAASLWEGAVVYLTDENHLVMSDGTTWRRLQLNQGALNQLPAFSAHKNGTDQTGVADTTVTQVTFSTEIYDIGSFFASNVWTPPAGLISLSAAYRAETAGAFTSDTLGSIIITKNGATSVFKQVGISQASADGASSSVISIQDRANGTDAYGVAVFINTTGADSTVMGDIDLTWFMGAWLSP